MELQAEKVLVILANLYLENCLLKEQIVKLQEEIEKIVKIRKEKNG